MPTPSHGNEPRAEYSSQPAASLAGLVGVIAALGLFLAALSLPPVVYFFLADWHPLARSVLSIILLAAVFGWLGTATFHNRRHGR